jgi:hypothetical protein
MTFAPIDPADLVWMRADYTAALADTCDIYNDAATRAAIQTGVPCFLAPVSALLDPGFASTGDRYESEGKWHLTLPYGTVISPGWQVRIQAGTATTTLANRVFSVVGLVDGSQDVVLKMRVEELR